MSDKERDVIENKVQKSLKHLLEALEELKKQVIHGNEAPDSVESRKGVLLILFQRIEAISTFFQTQRAKRIQNLHQSREGYVSNDSIF